MRVAVTGASGLIGTALVDHLRAEGHEVQRLVRRATQAADEVRWEPSSGSVDVERLRGVEGVVHLAGAGVGDHRWTASYKDTILRSRTEGTGTIARTLAGLDPRPRVLVSGSAMGVYGDRGDERLSETSDLGAGFLADVVRAWEGAADPAREAGIRVAHPRTGLVMALHGGAFGRLVPLARLGLAGPLGSGRQWWSWITLEDQVRALTFLLTEDVEGPVNLTSPDPRRQADVARAVARAFHRPAVLPAPAFALRTVLGELASDVLASQRVLPDRLMDHGFEFHHDDLDAAVHWLATRSR